MQKFDKKGSDLPFVASSKSDVVALIHVWLTRQAIPQSKSAREKSLSNRLLFPIFTVSEILG